MTYWTFLTREKTGLSFGLSFSFLSSFGQTFLVSLFVPAFLETFGLTNAEFGTMYSLATLGSALTIPYVGGWIDRAPLKYYSLAVIGGLMIAGFTVAVAWHIGVLFLGLYLLRLCGQGLSTHTSQTAMARHYQSGRGKALSVASLGMPIGEGSLPLLVTAILSVLSWRATWGVFVAGIGVVFLPALYLMLETSSLESDRVPGGDDPSAVVQSTPWNTYRDILSQPRIWFLAPAVLLPGFWLTALFLYQVAVADQLGWSVQLLASAFVGYALSRIGFSLGIGPAIDRWEARELFPYYLLPFAAGLLFAYYHPGKWSAFLYMGMVGVTMGSSMSVKTALWAELYGTSILGTVRSLFSSLMVFSTSLSPILVGWLLDRGISLETILAWAVFSVLVASGSAALALRSWPLYSPERDQPSR